MSWPIPERRERLLVLYRSGMTYRDIAASYGGTPHGVRSTIRKMRERGVAPDRTRVLGGKSKWVVA